MDGWMDQNHNPLPKIQKKIGAGALVGQELQLEDILKFERGWKGKKILLTRVGRKNENENGDLVEKGKEKKGKGKHLAGAIRMQKQRPVGSSELKTQRLCNNVCWV